MTKLRTKNNSIIGIDIGTHSIKAVEIIHLPNQTQLGAYSELSSQDINFSSPQNTTSAILKTIDNPIFGVFGSQNINISFPRSISQNSIVAIEKLRSNSIEKAIQEYISSRLNLSLSKYYFDYKLLNSNQKNLIYMIELIDRSYYDQLNNLLGAGNLNILSISSSNTVQFAKLTNQNESGVILVDIGYKTTSLFFCYKTNCIEKRIEFGADAITQSISEEFDISKDRCIELQKNIGVSGSTLASKIGAILSDELAKIQYTINEFVEECFDIFDIKNNLQLSIYLTGSLVSMPGFENLLINNISQSIGVVDPWKYTSLYPLKPMPKYRLPKYAGAISLALG